MGNLLRGYWWPVATHDVAGRVPVRRRLPTAPGVGSVSPRSHHAGPMRRSPVRPPGTGAGRSALTADGPYLGYLGAAAGFGIGAPVRDQDHARLHQFQAVEVAGEFLQATGSVRDGTGGLVDPQGLLALNWSPAARSTG